MHTDTHLLVMGDITDNEALSITISINANIFSIQTCPNTDLLFLVPTIHRVFIKHFLFFIIHYVIY